MNAKPEVRQHSKRKAFGRKIAPLLLGAILALRLIAHAQDEARHDAALEAAEAAARISEGERGADSPDTAAKLNSLARLYEERGQYATALSLSERALAICEKALGPDHVDTAQALNTMAELYKDMGQYSRALPFYERALAIREKVQGPDHADTAQSLNDLAALLRIMGQYAKAIPLIERALAIRENALGPDHTDTAQSLNVRALLHQNAGQYSEALPLYERALAINEKALGPDHPGTALILNNLANLYFETGEYTTAIRLHQRVLAIREKALGHDHPDTARSLNDLANLYLTMGQSTKALPLYERALAIREKALGRDHPDTARTLNNLAMVDASMGNYASALLLYERALAIREKTFGPDHPEAAAALNSLANLYREMGQYANALPLYERALAIREKALGPDHVDTARSLDNLANVYHSMGQYAKALPLRERALAIEQKALGPDHATTAQSLHNLAALYRDMGQDDKAIPLQERALAIREKALGPNHADTARSLNNLALMYRDTGQQAKALPLFERALAINKRALLPDHFDTAQTLNNLADLYVEMGQYTKSLPLYEQALEINEKALGPDHEYTAVSLNNLALLYSDYLGEPAKAFSFAQRAVRAANAAGIPAVSFNVRSTLAKYYIKEKMSDVGIFYGKQAVNTMQRLREGNRALDRELQRSLLQQNQKIYQQLADWLISAGRLAEAQQVLAMLKQDEYFEFIQRDAGDDGRTLATYTGHEPEWARRYEEISGQLAALGKELGGLRVIKAKGGLDAEQEKRLTQLEADMATASEAFDSMVAAMVEDLGSTQAQDFARERIDTFSALREVLGEMGEGVVLLHYVPLPERTHIILTTREVQLAREVDLGEEALNQKIARLREVLQDPRRDPRPLAQELYGLLLKPVAADLEQAGAKTVMLSLNGSLRYLPFAALYDGKQYVVERYALALYTDAAAANLKERAPAQVRVWGLGLTRSTPGFNALPNVKEELEGIIGAVPGQTYMDEAFTAAKLHEGLERAYPVLHIASHFRFTPGTEQDSYLVLGDGSHLTLAQVRHEYRFSGVDLLTLSACDSGFGGGRMSDGREVEGLGALAQKRGAHGVLAALWPVADQSTAVLMPEMYRLRQEQKLSKAEALRRVQIQFIRGRTVLDQPSDSPRAEPRYVAQRQTPYAHPYFWAPFILMGNWL